MILLKGEIPADKIYEDDDTGVFVDIAGDVDGHTLVIPKKHCTNVLDCDDDMLSSVIKTVKKISKHYVENCGYDGVNVLNANDKSNAEKVELLMEYANNIEIFILLMDYVNKQ